MMTATTVTVTTTDLKNCVDGIVDAIRHHRMMAMVEIGDTEATIAVVSRNADHPDYYRVVIDENRNVLQFYIGTTFYKGSSLVWGELNDWGFDPESSESPYCVGYYSMKDFLADYEGVDDTPLNCW